MVVTPGTGAAAVATHAGRAAEAGIDLFQVREKRLGARALLVLVREVMAAVAGSQIRVMVNGRADVAALAGAAGVHLPVDGLPPGEVRRLFPGLQIGVSTHTLTEARQAASAGADYLLFGPVFATPGKEVRATGPAALAEVVGAVSVPVLAIGGITAARAASIRRSGAAGLAAIRELSGEHLTARVPALRRAWDQA